VVSHLIKTSKDKKTAIYSALDELIEYGYCLRDQQKDEKGRYLKTDYIVFETLEDAEQFKKTLPNSGFPLADNPLAGNQPLLSIDPKLSIEKNITPPTPLQGERESYGPYVKLSRKEYEESQQLLGSKEALKDMIDDINDHISSTGRKPYKDYAATIRNWVKRRTVQGKSNRPISKFEDNISCAKKIIETFPEQAKKEEITMKETGLLFVYGNVYKLFDFTDFDFRTKVHNRLKSMGLYVSQV